MSALKQMNLAEVPSGRLHVWGRTNGRLDPLTLFWTGSCLELNVKAGELWLEVEADFSLFEQWAAVVVNGAVVSRLQLPQGRTWLCLFRGMNQDQEKNIRFVKEVQAMPNDPEARLQIHALRTDGSLEPVAQRPYRLEFVGDSITSGEGLAGAKPEEDWIPMFFSAAYGFPMLTADLCGAECRVISQSGWGVRSSWDNDPACAIPRIYTKVCGPLTGGKNRALGAMEENDFAAWQPDAVVVNLGTNDGGALSQPARIDPTTGESFRQTDDEAGQAAFRQAVVDFLKLLREKNPGAYLLWAYGMAARVMAGQLRRAVADYQLETGDKRVSFLLLPDTVEETVGSRQHPGRRAHARAAAVLADNLKGFLEGK